MPKSSKLKYRLTNPGILMILRKDVKICMTRLWRGYINLSSFKSWGKNTSKLHPRKRNLEERDWILNLVFNICKLDTPLILWVGHINKQLSFWKNFGNKYSNDCNFEYILWIYLIFNIYQIYYISISSPS